VQVDPEPETFVATITGAVRSLNQVRVGASLDEACAVHGLETTLDEVVFPALRIVGTSWSSGTVDVAHEHLLSAAVARWVAARSAALPAPTRRGTILLAAGPEDLHTLALDCLELLLVSRGAQVCNLGAQTPVASLLVAVRSVHPTAAVLSSHTPRVASQAVRSVRALAEGGVQVYFAGSSFASQLCRRNTPGTPLDGTLAETAEMIVSRHTTPPPEPSVLPRTWYRPSAVSA